MTVPIKQIQTEVCGKTYTIILLYDISPSTVNTGLHVKQCIKIKTNNDWVYIHICDWPTQTSWTSTMYYICHIKTTDSQFGKQFIKQMSTC